jgi:hypothetical protein
MTANPAPQEIPADVIQAENNSVRNLFGQDNPNPDLGHVEQTPDAPTDDQAGQEAPRELTAREKIAANAKARRKAVDEGMAQNEMGEYVPPFVKQAEDAANDDAASKAAEEEAARKAAEAPKTYKLKVMGNEIDVASRAELLKAADVDEDEATEYTERALIRLAQKNLAAQSLLDEAKAVKKSARTSARADEENTTPDPADTTDADETDQKPSRPNQGRLSHKDVIEAIQYGDPEEAAEIFDKALKRGVNEVLSEHRMGERVTTVESMIARATREFEAANPDLVGDEDFADITYNRALVSELKKDLLKAGLPADRVEATVGNHISKAMQAYIAVAADGRVKLRTPDVMLADAGKAVRAKFRMPAPTRDPAPSTSTTTAQSGRLDAKRGLTPQPSRASVPLTTTAPKNGQSPQARSNVVEKMRKARGQA